MFIILKFGFSSAERFFGWKHLASLIGLQSSYQQTEDRMYRMVPGLRPGRSEASAGMVRMAGRLRLSSMWSAIPGFFRPGALRVPKEQHRSYEAFWHLSKFAQCHLLLILLIKASCKTSQYSREVRQERDFILW